MISMMVDGEVVETFFSILPMKIDKMPRYYYAFAQDCILEEVPE